MVSLEEEAIMEEATLEGSSMEKRRISFTHALCSEVVYYSCMNNNMLKYFICVN